MSQIGCILADRGAEKRKELTVSLIFLLVFFLPHSSNVGILVHIALLFLVSFNNMRLRLGGRGIKVAFLPFLAVFFMSFVYNFVAIESLTIKDFFSKVYLVFLLLLFPFGSSVRLINPNVYFLAIGYILISQVSYAYNLPVFVGYYDLVYPYQGERLSYHSEYLLSGAGDAEFIGSRRYGGLYHNPNQAMKYMTLLYLGALLFWVRSNIPRFLSISLVVFYSVMLSGSRTALIVFLSAALVYLLFNLRVSGLKSLLSLAVSLVGLIFGTLKVSSSAQSDRAFQIQQGIYDSVGAKWNWLLDVLGQMDLMTLFLGHFWRSNLAYYEIETLDSEWGFIVFDFGLLGFLAWLLSLAFLFFKCKPRYRIIFVFMLWGVSSTIFMSYRTSFAFLIVFAACLYAQDVEKGGYEKTVN